MMKSGFLVSDLIAVADIQRGKLEQDIAHTVCNGEKIDGEIFCQLVSQKLFLRFRQRCEKILLGIEKFQHITSVEEIVLQHPVQWYFQRAVIGNKYRENSLHGPDAKFAASDINPAVLDMGTELGKGLSAFVDINGDGLPDKVFRKGGALYYRPQLRETADDAITYGEAIKVSGISSFSTVKSSTNTGGAKATVGWMALTAMVGGDVVKTKTQTTEYFSDINGDGLIDLVSNGKVYFNHIEFDGDGNAVPTFTESSADTPSPIIYSGEIDASVITISPEEQEEAIAASPMQDIVRVWQAPRAGTVSVSGTVRLVAPEGDYDADEYAKADGVRVAVQKGGTEYWSKEIAKGDGTAYEASASGISVQAGDRIYFRVQSGTEETANGSFDNVEWSPTVTYSSTSETLPNGYSTTVYKPE